jgi:hypothetical protein
MMSIVATEARVAHMTYRMADVICLIFLHVGDLLELEGVTGLGDNIGVEGTIGTFPQNAQGDLGAGHVKGKRAGFMRLWPMTAQVMLESGSLPSGAAASSQAASALFPKPTSNNE